MDETVSSTKNDENSQPDYAEYLNKHFAQNIAAFKKFFPEIASRFEAYTPRRSIEFIPMHDGVFNVFFPDTGQSFYQEDPIDISKKQVEEFISSDIELFHGSYEHDPFGQLHYKYLNRIFEILDESGCSLSEVSVKDAGGVPNCVMLGCGCGYQLAQLYKNIDVLNLVLIEPDPDLFFASLYVFDWDYHLTYCKENNFNFYVIIENSPGLVFEEIYSFYIRYGTFLACSFAGFKHYESDSMQKIVTMLEDGFSAIGTKVGFFDDFMFGASHGAASILAGKSYVLDEPMKKEFSNLPVFIIGNGPSLDKDLDFIKENQNKVVIVACGSAVDTLYHSGIKTDFYANTERSVDTDEVVLSIKEKEYFSNVILIASDTCHPNLFRCFDNTALFAKKNEPFYKILYDNFPSVRKFACVDYMNPLVGNMGVAGSVYLGFNRLFLFGMDNGKRYENTRIHASNGEFYINNKNFEKDACYNLNLSAKGNFCSDCKTNDLFMTSAFMISQLLSLHKDVLCANCSDGIAIKNTIPVRSETLAVEFESFNNIDKVALRNYIVRERTAPIHLSKDEIEKVFDSSIFVNVCAKLRQILCTEFDSKSSCIGNMMLANKYMYDFTQNYAYFYAECIYPTMQTFFINIVFCLFNSGSEENGLANARKVIELAVDFLNEAPYVFAHLPYYVMGEHKKYYQNQKVGRDMPHCKAPDMPNDLPLKI